MDFGISQRKSKSSPPTNTHPTPTPAQCSQALSHYTAGLGGFQRTSYLGSLFPAGPAKSSVTSIMVISKSSKYLFVAQATPARFKESREETKQNKRHVGVLSGTGAGGAEVVHKRLDTGRG